MASLKMEPRKNEVIWVGSNPTWLRSSEEEIRIQTFRMIMESRRRKWGDWRREKMKSHGTNELYH